ncbi:MAG: hypothetical protein FJZ57_06615 [Chlamydiae bacterium]|nr:hypothetical protein [Chlamydiota bacterium]
MTLRPIGITTAVPHSSGKSHFDPCNFLENSQKVLHEVHIELNKVKSETEKNIRVLTHSPVRGLERLFMQMFGHPISCSSRIGVVSNLSATASVVTNNHHCFIFSIIGSTIGHFIAMDEGRNREALERSISKLEDLQINLQQRNNSLKAEVTRMNLIVTQMQEESRLLRESNAVLTENLGLLQSENTRLQLSVTHLEKTIKNLEIHVHTLKSINSGFSTQLYVLKETIEEIKNNKIQSEEKKQTINKLEKSFIKMNEEFSAFSLSFITTEQVLTHQKQQVNNQLKTLSEVISVISDKTSSVGSMPELEIIKQQLQIAISGLKQYQKQLQSTQENIEKTQEKYKEEHKKVLSTQKICTTLLTQVQKISGKR